MNQLKNICQACARLRDHFYRFPETLAAALKARQQQTALVEQEAERLDRLRNPSKYRGK